MCGIRKILTFNFVWEISVPWEVTQELQQTTNDSRSCNNLGTSKTKVWSMLYFNLSCLCPTRKVGFILKNSKFTCLYFCFFHGTIIIIITKHCNSFNKAIKTFSSKTFYLSHFIYLSDNIILICISSLGCTIFYDYIKLVWNDEFQSKDPIHIQWSLRDYYGCIWKRNGSSDSTLYH